MSSKCTQVIDRYRWGYYSLCDGPAQSLTWPNHKTVKSKFGSVEPIQWPAETRR